MSGVLNIEPHIELTTIPVWEPRYHDNKVLVATKKVRAHNKIIFTYEARKNKKGPLSGKEFYISSERIKKYPKESNGVLQCYAVPLEDLMEMKQEKARIW